MKTTKMFQRMAMVAMLMSAIVATSCSDDDDKNELTVSKTKVELAPAATTNVTVSNGSQPYTATSSNTKIATAAVDKNTVTLTGVAVGKATVVITDNSKKTVSIGVEVKESNKKTK